MGSCSRVGNGHHWLGKVSHWLGNEPLLHAQKGLIDEHLSLLSTLLENVNDDTIA